MSSRRNKGGGGGHGGGGEERWLLPYADMITLLLGLFIVLFAMSTINAKQFEQVRRSLAQTFSGDAALDGSSDVLPGSNGVMDPTNPSQGQVDTAVALDRAAQASQERFEKETRKLQQQLQGLGKDVSVTRSEVGIQISIAGDALFASGSYQLSSPGLKRELKGIAAELRRFGHPIRIEGHTDGQPMGGEFGNYTLASNRALAVKFFFAANGYSHRLMHTVSYGPDNPKAEPKSPTASMPQNRRIEIIVLEPGAYDGFDNDAADAAIAERGARGAAAAPRAPDPAAIVDAQIESEFDPIISELAATGQAQ